MTGNNPSRMVITDRDRHLLEFVADGKILDREQVQHLLSFGSVTRANDRLLRLHDAGFLRRCFVGTTAGGRRALYALSPKGATVISREKFCKLRYADDELISGDSAIEHKLAVNWCWISLKTSADSGLVRFLRFQQPISPAIPLSPDGYAELDSTGTVQSVFLEVDLTTETSRVWNRKIELYLKLATTGEFERIFRQARFKVAVVCISERRLQSLRRIVRKHTPKLFYFALLQTIKRDGFRAPLWLRPEGDAPESIA